jgi:hypothetical protein
MLSVKKRTEYKNIPLEPEDICLVFTEYNQDLGFFVLRPRGFTAYKVHFYMYKKHRGKGTLKVMALFKKWCRGNLDPGVNFYCTVHPRKHEVRHFCRRIGMTLYNVMENGVRLYRISNRELSYENIR